MHNIRHGNQIFKKTKHKNKQNKRTKNNPLLPPPKKQTDKKTPKNNKTKKKQPQLRIIKIPLTSSMEMIKHELKKKKRK